MASILVLSDDVAVREVLWQRLRHHGHDVSMLARPAEALTAIREREPRLAFIDLDMPNMGGIEFVRQMQRTCPATAIAVMIEWDSPLAVGESEVEPQWVLQKPCTLKQIDEVLGKALP